MNTSNTPEISLENELEKLKTQLVKGEQNFGDFQSVYNKLQKTFREFQELLQWAEENSHGKEDEKKFKELYRQVAGWNASELMEKLKQKGFAFKKDSDLKRSFERQGYRILELVRSGKRDEVFHSILRIFVSAKEEFPSQLVEAFKPVYTEELFKVFLFSFLIILEQQPLQGLYALLFRQQQ